MSYQMSQSEVNETLDDITNLHVDDLEALRKKIQEMLPDRPEYISEDLDGDTVIVSWPTTDDTEQLQWRVIDGTIYVEKIITVQEMEL